MRGSDQARLMEINMLAEAITKVEVVDFGDNTRRDAFLVAAKKNLNELLTMFNGK